MGSGDIPVAVVIVEPLLQVGGIANVPSFCRFAFDDVDDVHNPDCIMQSSNQIGRSKPRKSAARSRGT